MFEHVNRYGCLHLTVVSCFHPLISILGEILKVGNINKHIQLPGGVISISTNLSLWCCHSRSDQGLFILHWNSFKLYHCMLLICV